MTFNFASRDYNTIKADLLARADRIVPEWTDRDPSDFGMMLVDMWASMGDVLHYYADRAASEAFLETATQRESVLAIANLLDYKPKGRSSAQAEVTVQNNSGSPYVLAQYTEFIARYNDRTYVVHATDTVTIDDGTSSVVPVGEGDVIEDEVLTDSASGLPGQTYTLSNVKAAPASVRIDVYEDGVTAVPYARVGRLSDASSGARVFTTNIGPDGFVEVQFGGLSNGFMPPNGSTVTVTYVSCSGEEGNLPANVVATFANSAPTGVQVTSSTAFAGGQDEESIKGMKQSIPSIVSAQDRAVTRKDFIALAQSVQGVSKASVEFTPGVAGPVMSTVSRQIASGVATVESTAHGLVVGDAVRVDGLGSDYDGVHRITDVPDVDNFSFATDGADEANTADVDGSVFKVSNSTAKLYCQPFRADYLTTPDTSESVSNDLRDDVYNVVQPRALLGVDVTTASAIQWVPVDVTATVYVNDKSVTNTVKNAVNDALDDLFDFDNVLFGQLLHLGQIHRTVLNVPGVDYVEVVKFGTTSDGPTVVNNTIRIPDYQLPKKGTHALTFVGGISVS